MMNDYQAPCYSIEECMGLLNCKLSELRFYIENGDIEAVVYTKPRRFLLFNPLANKQWVGHAVILYRGHYSLHSSYVNRLLDGEDININGGYGRLLDANGVSNVSGEYPFKKPCPHGHISAWKHRDEDDSGLLKLAATPFPKERENPTISTKRFISDIFSSFDVDAEEELGEVPPKDSLEYLELEFKSNSEFKAQDLRIPKSEVERFKDGAKAQKDASKAIEAIKTVIKKRPLQRENQLHRLIELILSEEPTISAKRAWAVIENDANIDEPVFDKDGILLNVDADCIDWKSRHGAEHTLSWSSFQPLLTKLKKSRVPS